MAGSSCPDAADSRWRFEVYYELLGQGPRLLFINGSGGDLRQKPRFTDGPLVEHFEVLAYDQRGLGQTTRPPGPYTMDRYADDAAGLLDALGWDRCAVFGVSFGGMVAQELAIRHPDRVTRMVLACTSGGGAGKPSYPLHELEGLPPENMEALERQIPDSTLEFFDGGHLFLMQDAAAFPRIIKFLSDVLDPGAGTTA